MRSPSESDIPTLAGSEGAAEASGEELPLVILPDSVDIEADLLRSGEQADVADAIDELDDVDVVEVATEILRDGDPAVAPIPVEVEEIDEVAEALEEQRIRSLLDDLEEELSAEDARSRKQLSVSRLYLYAALAIALSLLALLVVGWSYYKLPLSARALHHLHAVLRPSGLVGLPLGIAGAGLMLVSLVYLLRKHVRACARLGSLRSWLGFHVLTGVAGPALVLFHASCLPYSALGILAFSSMIVVVLSGIVGRYFHVYIPRSMEGRELELAVVRRRIDVYIQKLMALGVEPELLQGETAPPARRREPWLFMAFVRVVYGDRQSRRQFNRLREDVCSRPELEGDVGRILRLLRRLCRERQWLVRYRELRKLVGAWRFFHRWFAIILFLAVYYHVVIGVRFGDLWIFGGGS